VRKIKITILYLPQIPRKCAIFWKKNEDKEHAVASYLSSSFPLQEKKFNYCFSRNGNYCYRNK